MVISIKPIRGWKGNMGLKAGWTGLRLVRRLDHRQSDGNHNLASADGCYYTLNLGIREKDPDL